jgi:hypothetical protein
MFSGHLCLASHTAKLRKRSSVGTFVIALIDNQAGSESDFAK